MLVPPGIGRRDTVVTHRLQVFSLLGNSLLIRNIEYQQVFMIWRDAWAAMLMMYKFQLVALIGQTDDHTIKPGMTLKRRNDLSSQAVTIKAHQRIQLIRLASHTNPDDG